MTLLVPTCRPVTVMLPSPKSEYSMTDAFSTVQSTLVLVALEGETMALTVQDSLIAMLWTPLSIVTLDTGTTGSSQEKKRQRAAIKKDIMCFFIIIGITEAN